MSVDVTVVIKDALIEELELFHREVTDCVTQLPERELWEKPIEPGNSVGHLVLHLTGNLNHFVGIQLGQTGYVRDRDREFNEENVPTKAEALKRLEEAVATFRRVVTDLTSEQMVADHPESRLGSVTQGLTHLVAHFALHRGQMTYLVRLLEKQREE